MHTILNNGGYYVTSDEVAELYEDENRKIICFAADKDSSRLIVSALNQFNKCPLCDAEIKPEELRNHDYYKKCMNQPW